MSSPFQKAAAFGASREIEAPKPAPEPAALTAGVPGVTKVEASYEKKQAVVTFDDAKTTVEALTKATANAGYPSTVKN